MESINPAKKAKAQRAMSSGVIGALYQVRFESYNRIVDLAIILEIDEKDVKTLQEVVLSLEPSIEFRVFATVEEFADWFEELVQNAPEDELTVSLLISNRKILGQRHYSLFAKINEYMKKSGYLRDGCERIPILITAQNASGFKRETYQLDIFDNIIFKPFDEALARGKIHWAISGEDALSKEELTKQKPASPLEMLKNVRVDRITELGFRTISSERIPLGRLARYYMPSLKPLGENYGVFASCTHCDPIEGSEDFLCSFSYFGMGPLKAKNVRKVLSEAEDVSNLPLENSVSSLCTGVIVVSEERDLEERLDNSLNSSFRGLDYVSFSTLHDFLLETDPKQGYEMWLASQEEAGPILCVYNFHDGVFHRAYLSSDESQEVESFLGLDKNQLFQLRTLILKTVEEERRHEFADFWKKDLDQPRSLVIEEKGQESYLTVEKSEIFSDEESGMKRVRLTLRPTSFEEMSQRKGESRLPSRPRLMIVGETVFRRRDMQFWQSTLGQLQDKGKERVAFIVIGKTQLHLYDQAKELEGLTDYLVEPFDQTYLKKKVKYAVPEIAVAETVPSRVCSHTDEIIQVGVQVEVQNFSEVSLSVEYGRALEPNCFREFSIYIQAEKEYEELVAKHVSTESLSEGKYLNHFTIFGHGEESSQKIREWLNEQYALGKKES